MKPNQPVSNRVKKCFTFDKNIYQQFINASNKDGRVKSRILEKAMINYNNIHS